MIEVSEGMLNQRPNSDGDPVLLSALHLTTMYATRIHHYEKLIDRAFQSITLVLEYCDG